MAKIPRLQEFILRVNIELAITIFSLVLENSFVDFATMYTVWWPYKTPDQINTFLHNLDWTHMHVHDHPFNQAAYRKFSAFLDFCKGKRVNNALCYDASKGLLLARETEDNLNVLEGIGEQHNDSFFSFHVFSSLYRVQTVDMCATTLMRMMRSLHSRGDLESCVAQLRNRRVALRVGWEIDRMIPEIPLCSFATKRHPQHFYIHGWPPTYENILSFTYSKCVLQMLWYIIFDEL